MEKVFRNKTLIVMICIVLCIAIIGILWFTTGAAKDNASVRDVYLSKNSIDYQTMFNEFEDADLLIDEEANSLSFSGTQTLDASIFEEVDLVSLTNNQEGSVDVKYEFDYSANDNLFYLTVTATNVDGGEIVDKILGVPFVNDDQEIDIAFNVEDEVILLSELQENGALENCGWFAKNLKKIVKVAIVVAAVAAVEAVVIVAAPAVVAAQVANIIASRTYSTTEEKAKDTAKELQKQRPNDTIIFRYGSDTYYNLTPRISDTTGLSCNTLPASSGSMCMTTMQLVNQTGVLKSYLDGVTHVSIRPTAGDLNAWALTKETAYTNPHTYTVALKAIMIRI